VTGDPARLPDQLADSVRWGTTYFCLGLTNQTRKELFICTLWVPIHLSFISQQRPPLSSLSGYIHMGTQCWHFTYELKNPNRSISYRKYAWDSNEPGMLIILYTLYDCRKHHVRCHYEESCPHIWLSILKLLLIWGKMSSYWTKHSQITANMRKDFLILD